jgi:hypothetical protein
VRLGVFRKKKKSAFDRLYNEEEEFLIGSSINGYWKEKKPG